MRYRAAAGALLDRGDRSTRQIHDCRSANHHPIPPQAAARKRQSPPAEQESRSYVMDQVGHADSKTTLEIYAQVQKRVSRKNVHAAFDELLNGANRDTVRSRL
jgi:integrase